MNTKPNAWDILESLRSCPGLAHYFLKADIQTISNTQWVIQGKQQANGFYANVSCTTYGNIKVELAIKWIEAPQQLLPGILPVLEALEGNCNGLLKLFADGDKPNQFILLFVVYIPLGYNDTHLSMLAEEIQALTLNCEKIDEVLEMGMKMQKGLTKGMQVNSEGQPQNGNIWDSIAHLDNDVNTTQSKTHPEIDEDAWTNQEVEEISVDNVDVEDILKKIDEEDNNKDEEEPNNESNT